MGNSFSDVSSGAGAIAGVSGTTSSAALCTTNDAVEYYLKSPGFNGRFSQIELSFSASNLRDGDVLSKIITKSTRTITLELKRKEGLAAQTQPHHGKLTIHAEESLASKITTEIVFRCSSLESKDLFSKSDPFLVVSKIVEHGTPIPVSKTKVLKNDLNPIWKPLSLCLPFKTRKKTVKILTSIYMIFV